MYTKLNMFACFSWAVKLLPFVWKSVTAGSLLLKSEPSNLLWLPVDERALLNASDGWAAGSAVLIADATMPLPSVLSGDRAPHNPTVAEESLGLLQTSSRSLQVPALCSNETFLGMICKHWEVAIDPEDPAIIHGSSVCCDYIPAVCQSQVSCTNTRPCGTPSCDNKIWYLSQFEATVVNDLIENSIDVNDCIFATAPRKACSSTSTMDAVSIDETQMVLDVQSFQDSGDVDEESQIVKENMETCSTQSCYFKKMRHAKQWWHDIGVSHLEWRIEEAGAWAKFGIDHSYLLANTSHGIFRMEKDAPLQAHVMLSRSESPGGRLHMTVGQKDLRANLTISQILSHFPSKPWNFLFSNCHQAAEAAFSWSAPAELVVAHPNPVWKSVLTAMLTPLNKTAPRRLEQIANYRAKLL